MTDVRTQPGLFIDGRWTKPSSNNVINVGSPNTGELLATVPAAEEADVDVAVQAARRAFDDPAGWSRLSPGDRAHAMRRLADSIEERTSEFAVATSSQNGMPIALSTQTEAAFPALLLRYYADMISAEGDDVRDGMLGGRIIVERDPVGVVAAITPWNFPQTLAFFKIAPALAAGCTLVVKPSPETVLDMTLLAEAVMAADLPPGVLNIVPADRVVGAYLVAHPGVDKVAFTGSTAAGRQIAEACGKLLRPVTLELGGKSAAIILDDVDLATMGTELYGATLANNGQTCYVGTRVLAPRSRYTEVVDALAGFVSSLPVGNSLDPTTLVGPMVTEAHRTRVESYIRKGRAEGARIVTGGGRPSDQPAGWFVEPTVFADVDNSHTIAQEEIFGPVLSVIPYDGDEEAIRIANDSDYGLGGTVWTSDAARGLAVASQVKTGTIGINRYLADPAAPFGGVKASGLGRELGPEGLAAYRQTRTVYC